MKKTTYIFVITITIGSMILASSRMGRPLHNSPVNIPLIALEIAAPAIAMAAQALLPSLQGFDNPENERVICVGMGINHAHNASLSGGTLLPVNPSLLEEVEKKEKIQKIDVSTIRPMRPILTEEEQQEAAAYKQKLEAGDLKQKKDDQWSSHEELGTYC